MRRHSGVLEILDGSFVLLGGNAGRESAEVAAFAGLGILLAGIEAVAAGGELADHGLFGFLSTGMVAPGRVSANAEIESAARKAMAWPCHGLRAPCQT
jgi:hypothetical protein